MQLLELGDLFRVVRIHEPLGTLPYEQVLAHDSALKEVTCCSLSSQGCVCPLSGCSAHCTPRVTFHPLLVGAASVNLGGKVLQQQTLRHHVWALQVCITKPPMLLRQPEVCSMLKLLVNQSQQQAAADHSSHMHTTVHSHAANTCSAVDSATCLNMHGW
jgi:hypothetical protein